MYKPWKANELRMLVDSVIRLYAVSRFRILRAEDLEPLYRLGQDPENDQDELVNLLEEARNVWRPLLKALRAKGPMGQQGEE